MRQMINRALSRLVIASAVALVACQDTPEDPVVSDMKAPVDEADMRADGEDMPAARDMSDEQDMAASADMSDDSDMGGPDMSDMEPYPDDPIGVVNLTYWTEDAVFPDAELLAHAVFSPELAELGLLDPAGWVTATTGAGVFIYDDYWQIPKRGGSVDASEPMLLATEPSYLDAGEFVVVGDHVVAPLLDELQGAHPGLFVYEALKEDAANLALMQDLSGPLDLEIEGGEGVPSIKVEDAFSMPARWQFNSHDPNQKLALRYGRELVFDWEPTADPGDEVLLSLENDDGIRVFNVEDTGSVDVAELIDGSGFRLSVGDGLAIAWSRVKTTPVQTPAGVVLLRAARKQWFYPERVGPYELTPDVLRPGTSVTVRFEWRDGVFGPDLPTVELGAGVQVSELALADTIGHILEFTATIDEAAPTGQRDFVVTTPGGDELRIPEVLWVAGEFEAQGDCEDTVDEGFVEDGAYTANDGGLDFGLFVTEDTCYKNGPDGREQVYPLQLQRGQRLSATLMHPAAPGSLYLVKSCDDLDDVEACVAAPRRGADVSLDYLAYHDEDVLLVVDSYGDDTFDAADYLLEIERSTPQAFGVEPETIPAGALKTLQVVSFAGDFDADATFDLGPEVAVEEVRIYGNYAEVDVRADFSIADPVVGMSTSIGGVAVSIDRATHVIRDLSGPASCQDADMAGAVGPGSYTGFNFTGGDGVVSVNPCKMSDAIGKEAIFRIDLGPSETLSARVAMLGGDAVLYVVPDCDSSAVVCSDESVDGGYEYVEWTGPAYPSTVYLVVDGFDTIDEDVFELDIDISL